MTQNNQYQTVGLLSIWESRPDNNTDYNGKVQWMNQDTGEFDFKDTSRQQLAFYRKKQSKKGSEFLVGSVCDKDRDGDLVYSKETALFVNNSHNEKAPALTGNMKDDNTTFRIALWRNDDSDNEKAPKFKGKVQAEVSEGESDIPF